MSSYKVTYFNATWMGEPIRFMLSHQGIKFDDVRLNQESFEAAKKSFPTQQVPTLEIDGKVMFQSATICRYLANKFGLAGANDDEKTAADTIVDTIIDLRTKTYNALFRVNDEDVIAAKKKELLSGYVPAYLTYLNGQAKLNGGFFVGGKLTWADLFFSAEYDIFLKYLGDDVYDNYPALLELNKTVRSIPNIKKWVETRPISED